MVNHMTNYMFIFHCWSVKIHVFKAQKTELSATDNISSDFVVPLHRLSKVKV